MLATNDNAALLSRVATGDAAAEEELISVNMGLVKNIARRFIDNSSGIDFDDICQIGAIGMLRAARSFDPSFGTVFSTFAVPLIIGEIRRFLRDDGLIKVSRSIKANSVIIRRAAEKFRAEFDREPRIGELINTTGLSADDVTAALEASVAVRSLSETVGEDGETELGDMISSDENEIEALTDSIALRQVMRDLSEDQRQLLYLRFNKRLSQSQAGEILGLTQVKVSREEKRILEKLRGLLV